MKWSKKAQLDFIDTDIFYEPSYWILTGGCILALLIGFKLELFAGGLTGKESTMGMLSNIFVKLLIILCVPVISYFLVKKIGS